MSDERRHKAQPFPKNEIRKEKEMNEYVVEARDIVKSYGKMCIRDRNRMPLRFA